MTWPAPGTYLRPVGTLPFCYCGRLVRVVGPEQGEWDAEPWVQWQFLRFGLDRESMDPVKDGHQNMFYIDNLQPAAPGVWREHGDCDWFGQPRYWREMGQRGQLSLFGDAT